MTTTAPRASRSPMLGIGALLVLALIGAVIGAYLDWKWWHPMSGITVTIGAGALLVAGGLLSLAEDFFERPHFGEVHVARGAAHGAVGIGIFGPEVVGQ